MAINKQPVARKCRALGVSPAEMGYGKKQSKRNPGGTRRKKVSEYGAQLKEKQKVKFVYGVLEKQFHKYYLKATNMKGIIGYTADQVVSADLIANPCPCIFDETAGIMLDDDFVKLIAWYDNEYGYSNMVVRLLEHMVAVASGLIVPEKREVPQDAPSGK